MRRTRPLLAPLAALLLPSLAHAQWRETHGGPLGTYATDQVDAPLTAPAEVWRVDFDAILAGPVVDGEVAAVLVQKGRIQQLVLLDVATGAELARTRVKMKERAALSLDGVHVSVATDQEFVAGVYRTGKFKRTVHTRNPTLGAVATLDGFALVLSSEGTDVYDVLGGDHLQSTDPAVAKPIVLRGKGGNPVFHVLHSPVEDEFHRLEAVGVTRGGGNTPRVVSTTLTIIPPNRAPERAPETPFGLLPFSILRSDDRGHVHVYGSWSRHEELGPVLRHERLGPTPSENYIAVSSVPAVVWGERILGRFTDHSVTSLLDGFSAEALRNRKRSLLTADELSLLVHEEHIPEGARQAPMSAVSGVLILGNWAIDIRSSRVLWIAPDLDVVGRPIPAGDGAILFEGEDGALVFARAVPGGGTVAAAPRRVVPEGVPGEGPALVLRDGSRIAGNAERNGDSVVVTAPDGTERGRWDGLLVGALERADGTLEVDVPYTLYRVWDAALRRDLRNALLEVAAESAELALVANARDLVVELERLGATPDELGGIENLMASKRELSSSTRDIKLEKVGRMEAEARAAAEERRTDAVRWIAERGWPIQAAALLDDHWRDEGETGPPDEVDARVRALLVEIGPDDIRLTDWLVQCRSFAPANARSATKEETRTIDAQTKAWLRCAAIRSPHVMLLSHAKRVETIAGVLLFAETTIDALDRLLGPGEDVIDRPLDVRLFDSRKAYLAEELGGTPLAPGWSAGFYNEAVRTSRFFVPDIDAGRLERQLYQVVAHELTHQYIAERWARRANPGQRSARAPGFWVVEGFADFIEDQSVEMARFGGRLDDPTVESIEVAAALLELDALMPMADFLALRQLDLTELALRKESHVVHLQRERASYDVNALSAFYAQAGALAFFVANRTGPEGRERLVEALATHYVSRTEREGWTALGFESADALQAAFEAFLRDPSAR